MPRIHFTVEDLSRVRLKVSLGPVAETVFALDALGRNGNVPHQGWRSHVNRLLRDRPTLTRVVSSMRWTHTLLGLVDRDLEVGAAASTRRQATEAVLEVWQLAIAPYWGRMFGHLDSECDIRGRLAMSDGVEALLATLHSRVNWNPPVLEIPGDGPEDVHLDGRGLVLCPSLFQLNRPGVLIGAEWVTGQPALVFPAPPDPAQADRIWGDGPDDTSTVQVLGTLVGQTRAAVLQSLTQTSSTKELAERLGISSAGASQHAAVLRRTGLISTRRVRNTVLHTVTPLGLALLGGRGWDTGTVSRVPLPAPASSARAVVAGSRRGAARCRGFPAAPA